MRANKLTGYRRALDPCSLSTDAWRLDSGDVMTYRICSADARTMAIHKVQSPRYERREAWYPARDVIRTVPALATLALEFEAAWAAAFAEADRGGQATFGR